MSNDTHKLMLDHSQAKVKLYGEPGQEICLRTETIYYLNNEDWAHYLPVAKVYLEKYGKNLPQEERQTFSGAVKQHEKN